MQIKLQQHEESVPTATKVAAPSRASKDMNNPQHRPKTQITAETLAAQAAVLKQAARRRKTWALTWLGIISILSLAPLTHRLFTHRPLLHENWFIAIDYVCLFLFFIILKRTSTSRLLQTVAQYDDVRTVGMLVDMLASDDRETYRIAEAALIRLLPRLKASNAALLNREQRRSLCYFLESEVGVNHSEALSLAILKAFEQMGDSEALPAMKKLASGHGQSFWFMSVRMAAQACLPYLQERYDQERISQTLLRASGPVGTTSEEDLLRPVQGTPTTEIDQLLRVTDAEDEEKAIGGNDKARKS